MDIRIKGVFSLYMYTLIHKSWPVLPYTTITTIYQFSHSSFA